MLKTRDLYDLKCSIAGEYLSGFEYPWEALKGIKDLILTLGPTLGEEYTEAAPPSGSTGPPKSSPPLT